MRILLLGKNGQVGFELQRSLAPLGEVIALGRAEADLFQPKVLRGIVRDLRPQAIVNSAAYTDVDRAEDEPDIAMTVNGVAPGVLAEEARRIRAVLIHYSTDYVFDGTKGAPYVESDEPNPLNVYGRSKLEGERAIRSVGGAFLILRTGWVYGLWREDFVTMVLRWAREGRELRIVHDQIGSPTWARTLAEVTGRILIKKEEDMNTCLQDRAGLYHLAGTGQASRYEWANAILQFDPHPEEQRLSTVVAASTSEFASAARRPAFSALDCNRFGEAFHLCLPPWRESLKEALLALRNQ